MNRGKQEAEGALVKRKSGQRSASSLQVLCSTEGMWAYSYSWCHERGCDYGARVLGQTSVDVGTRKDPEYNERALWNAEKGLRRR